MLPVTSMSRRQMRQEIASILRPAGGYVDLDPLSVDLPSRAGRHQAISIEGGKVAAIDCDTTEDAYWTPLDQVEVLDLRELLTAVRWADENDGLEVD